jgi:hypothetical protein
MGTWSNDELTPEQFKKRAKLTKERDQLKSKTDELEFINCALIVALDEVLAQFDGVDIHDHYAEARRKAHVSLRRAREYDKPSNPRQSGSELDCDWCGREVINGEGRYPETEDGALDDRVCADCDHLRKSVYGLRSRV